MTRGKEWTGVLEARVRAEIRAVGDEGKREHHLVHLFGVAQAAVMLARRRGADPELAYAAALLHDLYAYRAGTYEDHARLGADLAGEILRELKLFSPEEERMICQAIARHDDTEVFSECVLDEVLKDADLIQNHLSRPAWDAARERDRRVAREITGK